MEKGEVERSKKINEEKGKREDRMIGDEEGNK
jgi:hypothetical protein